MNGDAREFAGWLPAYVRIRATPSVEWAIVDRAFDEPFFEQTIEAALQHPFNRIFARRTELDALAATSAAPDARDPCGFVFHMSRCGSTLITQALSALSGLRALSEPQPVDAILRLRGDPRFESDVVEARLRDVVRTLARGEPRAERTIVKFNVGNVFALDAISRAFPRVPRIFVFREPRAVLLSQSRTTGTDLMAGTLDPTPAGMTLYEAATMPPLEYVARTIGAICRAALDDPEMTFVEYSELPEAILTHIAPLFGLRSSAATDVLMLERTRYDAKSGDRSIFRPRESSASPGSDIDSLAARYLDAPYAALRRAAAAR